MDRTQIKPELIDVNTLKLRVYYESQPNTTGAEELHDKKACPKCSGSLFNTTIANTSVLKCTSCSGIFVPYGALEKISSRYTQGNPPIEMDPPQKAPQKTTDELYYFDNNRKSMACPQCDKNLRESYVKLNHSIWVDICDQCKGVFYDYGELTKVLQELSAT